MRGPSRGACRCRQLHGHALFQTLAIEQWPTRAADALGMADPLVWIEIRGIAGQDMQRQLAAECVHVVPRHARLVRGKTIDDQGAAACAAAHHPAQQGDAPGAILATGIGGKPEGRWR